MTTSTATPLEALIRVSHTIGEPHRDLALLAEGNTSVRSGPSRMLVKASGSSLRTATVDDFVDVDLARVMRLVDSEHPVNDDGVAAAMREAVAPGGRRPSVEALLHAVCLEAPEVGAVIHTHPVVVNALLCSDRAEALVGGSLFPDQVVVLGRHNLLVPYVDPGLPLARAVLVQLRAFVAEHGTHPRVVYLRNHGMFTLGVDPDDAFAVTEMAVKSAGILHGALAVGAVVPLDPAHAERIDTRPDEAFRRRRLAGTEKEQP